MIQIFKASFYAYLLKSLLTFSVALGNISHLGHLRTQQEDVKFSSDGDFQQSSTNCRISSKELLAAAESTARSILQGICNPREIEDRLHNIESQMADQLNVIKTMILNIEDKLAQQDSQYRRANRKLHGVVAELSESVQACTNLQFSASNSNHVESSHATNHEKQGPASPSLYSSPLNRTTGNGLFLNGGVKSTGADPDEEDVLNPRQDEIDRFNSSIHVESGKRVFSYFWKVTDMEYKLKSWGPRRSLRSPSFYIFEYGYMMYMRLFPRQNGQNVYTHVGLTKGDYDEALEWPFILKHRVSILDQASPPFQDIVSRVWDPKILCSGWNWKRPVTGDNHECVGLGFPTEDLRGQSFLREDSVLIKLTVFLD
ncbi:uncharacterized protein LOC116922116 isoform X1 [Daphnia magna]|uniref:uncharacterized protein LOC116922116 isoform X1 n=2 Tax=Daphnia magna TaxID=35525 RepID=UPI001E1BAFDA|nr:uncharacterized protein LOC116922116 isoform X1 [Daphnia magna]